MSSTKFLEANNEQKIQELQRGNQGTPHKQTHVAANLSCKKKTDILKTIVYKKESSWGERKKEWLIPLILRFDLFPFQPSP